jgi:hypothetical protein
MARTIHLLRFRNDQPVWFRFEAGHLTPSEAPDPKDRSFVVAILPDELFFYYQPTGVQTSSGRKARAAARLQMHHLFPAFGDQRDIGVFRPVQGRVLGFFSRPGLQELLDQHQELLAGANVITTELALCWFDAMERGLSSFVWRGENGLKALYASDNLEFFKGDDSELESRLAREEAPEAEPLELEPVVARRLEGGKKWSAVRVPVRQSKADQTKLRPYKRAMLVLLILGLFFLAGQLLRLQDKARTSEAWRTRLDQLYATVLGPQPGPDPYGKLLYTLDQLQQGRSQGVNVLETLAILSQEPPQDLKIENLNLSVDSGAIRGLANSYDALESYLETLNTDPGYTFTLEQASNTEQGIQFTLRVTMPQ